MLDETIDPLGEHTLQIALTRPATSVGGHHPRDGCVGTEKRAKLGSSFELGREDGLEHGQQQVLFSRLVLVSVKGEHDCLEKGVDLCERYESTEVRDMSGLRLKEKEEVRVLLKLAVVRVVAFRRVHLFKMLLYFVLLRDIESKLRGEQVKNAPHQEPYGSGLAGRYGSRGNGHHARERSYASTEQISGT